MSPFQSKRICIAPSILSADFSMLGAECDQVLEHGGDFLHLDVMDGHFVPNISFGPPVIRAVRAHVGPDVFLDAHLMISEPLRYAEAHVKAGVDSITFHIETVGDPVSAAKQIRDFGVHVGITLNPPTPVQKILPALEAVDFVLVMSVNPGFSGQSFIADVLSKVHAIKAARPDLPVQIDGGINLKTIAQARTAGVDWFVIASAIFDQPDRAQAIADLRSELGI